MTVSYWNYINRDKLPHMWCEGCGNGIVVKAVARALAQLEIPNHQVVIATGIGCFGKADDYFKTHGFHGTHGRALAFATGIKTARPELTVLVLMGDGDCSAIGGNHLIQAARRNVDITAVVANNYNYGMTGGQYSSTTPLGSVTTTSPLGTAEPGFDLISLTAAAGANYVARASAYDTDLLVKLIVQAIQKKGFSFVDVISPCTTYYGRYNKQRGAVKMMEVLRDRCVNPLQYAELPEEKKRDAICVGCLVDRNRPDWLTVYRATNRAGVPEN